MIIFYPDQSFSILNIVFGRPPSSENEGEIRNAINKEGYSVMEISSA